MTPETERRFVELALARHRISSGAVADLERARLAHPEGRRRTIARVACEAGLLSSKDARALLREVRAAVPKVAPTRDSRDENGVFRPGSQLAQFKIRGVLGKGGMGVVYRALDLRFNREVALKTILGEADPETVERFVREAKAAGRLKHPNIVPVFEHGVAQGVRYMALELVEGKSLAGLLKSSGPLSPGAAARIVRDLALAVAEAHAQGVLHRDLKPANVLLDKEDRPRLTDFGLARDERERTLTRTGDVLGTPIYMAPEQALGDKAAISPETNVYGLGAILFEILTGEPPFKGPSGMAVMRKILEEEPRRPSVVRLGRGLAALPIDLETICLKCLEKTRERRYTTAQELAFELGHFLDGEPIAARPPGRRERARRWVLRNRAVSAASVTLVVALLLTAAVATVGSIRAARVERAEHDRKVSEAAKNADASQRLFEDAARTAARHKFGIVFERPTEEKLLVAALQHVKAREALYELLGPPDETAKNALRATYSSVGDALLDAGHVELACDYFSKAEKEPEKAKVRIDLAHDRARHEGEAELANRSAMADLREAELVLSRLVVANPHLALAVAYRGCMRNEIGDAGGAFSDLTLALGLMKGQPCHLWVERGRSRYLLGDYAGAVVDCNTALGLDPAYGPAFFGRANARRQQGDFAGALHDCDSALQLHLGLDMDRVHMLRAESLWQTGKHEAGEAAMTRVITEVETARGFMPHAFWFRGKMRAARGDRTGAAEDFRAFLAIFANGPDADDARAQLAAVEAGH